MAKKTLIFAFVLGFLILICNVYNVSAYIPSQPELPYNLSAAQSRTQAIGFLFGNIVIWAWQSIIRYWIFILIGIIIIMVIGLRLRLSKKKLILEARR